MTLPGRRRPGRSLKEGCNIGPGGHTQPPQPPPPAYRPQQGRKAARGETRQRVVSTAIYRFVASGHGLAMTRARTVNLVLAEASDTPVATILREMGKDYATIAEMLGQKSTIRAWLTHPRRWRDGQRSRCRGVLVAYVGLLSLD